MDVARISTGTPTSYVHFVISYVHFVLITRASKVQIHVLAFVRQGAPSPRRIEFLRKFTASTKNFACILQSVDSHVIDIWGTHVI